MKTRKLSRGMNKSIISLFVTVSLLLMCAFPAAANDSDPFMPPGGADWNRLIELKINSFGWNDGNVVTDDTYLGQEAKKIETTAPWMANYTLNGWQALDLSLYENGTLEFDAVGAAGGETFSVGFVDVVMERVVNGEFYMGDGDSPYQTSEEALISLPESLTTEWKRYSIPLKDIFDANSIFDSSSVQLLRFKGDNSPETFWISNIVIHSPDRAPSYAPIKVNQVGYILNLEKYALVSGYYDELTAMPDTPFQVRKASDMSIAYSGALSLVTAYDESSGEKVLKADFTDLNEPGEYVLTVDGVDEPSVAFQIGDGSIYSTLLKDVQKFFYFQRANVDLLEEHAGIFARTGARQEDYNLPFQSDPTITKDVSGGWWDAGDLAKYVTVGATAISDLLWAYESFPSQFQDHSLNIPESGNGIPDLLDEIKVETDFLLKMQDEETGGFYAYVIRDAAPNRFIMDGTADNRLIPTYHTGAAVGALTHAYIVMKDFPELEDYAETLLDAALRGWNYLEQNPEFIPQPDGPYNSDSDVNDRFYAAATLYRATGEQVYSDYVGSNYTNFADIFEQGTFSHNTGSLVRIGFYHYMMGEQPDPTVQEWFTDKFIQWRDIVIDNSLNNAVWRNSPNGFYWGANSNAAGVPVGLAIGSRLLGLFNEDDLKVASGNLNYLLGINPLQMSYITGHGERRVVRIFHSIYNADFLLEVPNGYMPGGANNNGRYTFAGKAYNSASVDWNSNEPALNYNSPLTYLVALLSETNSAPSVVITSYEDDQAINSNRPQLDWTFIGADDADVQAAYQVQASSDGWETIDVDSGELLGASNSYTFDELTDGDWAIRVRVKDNRGAWSEWAYRNLRINTVAPTLNVALDKETLWPANNKLVKVTATVETDVELSQVELLSITPSVEVDRHESMVQEAEFGTFDTEFKLLARKAKGKEPLVYTITYRAIDEAGNATEASASVTVPHNQSGKK
ncbi:glycoside hydrolase family 9 protein [Halalkalibacterium halodurans]|uniref:glycoside hydrolase family 9 protein n=1 Tax=Halalkalibacterium halodurans TaxID=86665 RepID=UPI002AAA3D5E|nr:glycoside hydrolase family 9 protein [Halalkalibacterium halodurans]MDY7221502.1 glycoside hydrolase family 9 protein [Halalkalibacterium halodurans]MDY7240778.1 glycoside hydrolase family 9 protein [Halalkalibacterium halodurans]